MDVPPMEFDVDKKLWEASAHRLALRQISIEKQTALSTLIDELLERDAIQGHSVVPGSPGTKAEWRVAFHHRLPRAEQGDH